MSLPIASSDEAMEKPAVILFGDSLTAWSFHTHHGQGFGDVLEKQFKPLGIKVENEGYPGFTSETVKPLFAAIIKRIRTEYKVPPLFVTIFLGANDAVLTPSVHVPIDTFAENVRGFVNAFLAEPNASKTKILLITTPPINVRAARRSRSPSGERLSDAAFEEECRESIGVRTWDRKLKYAKKIVEIAAEYNVQCVGEEGRVAVVDFWIEFTNFALVAEGRQPLSGGCSAVNTIINDRLPGSGLPGAKEFPDGCFGDRLHFDADGYKVLTASVIGTLRSVWPDMIAGTAEV